MSLFQELSDAKTQSRGAKIQEPLAAGATQDFVVELSSTKVQESNQGLGQMFIVEFIVRQGTETNPPGAERSWVQFPKHRKQTDPGNCKAFAAAVAGIGGSDPVVPPEVFEGLINGEYVGVELKLTTEKIMTKSGHDFWVHTWTPAPTTVTEVPEITEVLEASIEAPDALTEDQWKAGAGPGVEHPKNPSFEYSPDHPEWGVRIKG